MFQLVFSSRFKRNLKNFLKRHPELRDVFREKLIILEANPHDSRLRSHKLTGKLKHCLAVSVTFEYRIVFTIEGNSIFLLAIGTHDEVY